MKYYLHLILSFMYFFCICIWWGENWAAKSSWMGRYLWWVGGAVLGVTSQVRGGFGNTKYRLLALPTNEWSFQQGHQRWGNAEAAHVAKSKTGNIKKCEDEMVSLAFPTSWGVARKLFPLSWIEWPPPAPDHQPEWWAGDVTKTNFLCAYQTIVHSNQIKLNWILSVIVQWLCWSYF